MPADERLDELADSVSDARPVDWNDAESSAVGSGEQASIQALRQVAQIAEFNRGLQRSPHSGPGAAAAGAAPLHWGELTLLEPAGSGASGEVWRAWDPTLRREVALKFLTVRAPGSGAGDAPEISLLEEARALARVRHPGVVAVHGIAEHDGRPGMWMEYLAGATLAAEMERRGALPPGEVARIGLALCRALEAVDAAGLV